MSFAFRSFASVFVCVDGYGRNNKSKMYSSEMTEIINVYCNQTISICEDRLFFYFNQYDYVD